MEKEALVEAVKARRNI